MDVPRARRRSGDVYVAKNFKTYGCICCATRFSANRSIFRLVRLRCETHRDAGVGIEAPDLRNRFHAVLDLRIGALREVSRPELARGLIRYRLRDRLGDQGRVLPGNHGPSYALWTANQRT